MILCYYDMNGIVVFWAYAVMDLWIYTICCFLRHVYLDYLDYLDSGGCVGG